MSQIFGGFWTEEKLYRVRSYLDAYAQVMKNQHHFTTMYVDAFAGTGSVRLQANHQIYSEWFEELEDAELETGRLIQGSAEQALEVEPRFDEFIFIEQSSWRFNELSNLRNKYPQHRMDLRQGDANEEICRICATTNWRSHRAVLFLDPFGMAVEWTTLEAIAKTGSIDMWYLFPLMAVNRHLRNKGNLHESERNRLDRLFGATDWEEQFYVRRPKPLDLLDLMEGREEIVEETEQKIARVEDITAYFLDRLRKIFPAVAQNPLLLMNRKGSPLFLLCFAVSNPHGQASKIALKIANHILGMN